MADMPFFQYVPARTEPVFKEGVTAGWVCLWSGEPGPARMLKVAALADEDGYVTVEPDGEWQDVTVFDDTESLN